jgi:hypothetical protein
VAIHPHFEALLASRSGLQDVWLLSIILLVNFMRKVAAFTLLIYNSQREFQQNCATVVGLG